MCRTLWGGLLVTAGLLVGVLVGFCLPRATATAQAPAGPADVTAGTVRCRRLVIEDDQGRPRVLAGPMGDAGAAGVTLYDVGGRPRASLGLLGGGWPSVMLLDTHGTIRGSLLMNDDGRVGLAVFDADGALGPMWPAAPR